MKSLIFFRGAITIVFSMIATCVSANIERLDDSASSQRRVSPQRVAFTPVRSPLDGFDAPNPTHATVQFGRVNYRLNTARYVGKKARIFWVIPSASHLVNSPAALRVEWRGGRMIANGSGHAGERIAVWQGVVTRNVISEDIELSMQIDLRRLQTGAARMGAAFESYFEIEVLP
jgi:hypothetical protein